MKEDYGIDVKFVGLTADFDLDLEDFKKKLDDRVKIVSFTQVSNTIGQIFDLQKVAQILDETYPPEKKPLFIVDGSQSVPHFQVDVKELGCDALFFTGHKIFADSGIWVLWARQELLQKLKPIFSGGGAIGYVKQDHFTHSETLPDKFEPGTPNLTGAVSLLRAFEYVESIGGYEILEKVEQELVVYALQGFQKLWEKIRLLGSDSTKNRVWVFTFCVIGIHSHDIAEYLAENHICIRAGQHCAEPAMDIFGVKHSCRMSLHIYNTQEDIDKFFEILQKAIQDLG